MRVLVALVMVLVFAQERAAEAAAPATQPATTQPVDAALWDRLTAIDARAGKIVDLVAEFRQEKFTPLLKKPLVSSGSVYVKGSVMLWRTTTPEPTILRIDEKDARIYYPSQKTVEIYPVDSQLSNLAASPLPRLEILKKYFSFKVGDKTDNDDERVALTLTPINPALAEHVTLVRVLLDAKRGLILRMEFVADQDRTVLTFSSARTNQNLSDQDVELTVPPGTTVTRPLDGQGSAN